MTPYRRSSLPALVVIAFIFASLLPATFAAVNHVLLISIDGLHASDLTQWVALRPESALALLAGRGAVYPNARTPTPSDSFPGILALVTGGTPAATGVYYDDTYDRTLSPPGSNCSKKGTEVLYDETIDKNVTLLNGGGGINPATLPLDPRAGCKPVYPSQYNQLNTIFEVVTKAGLTTAWADKHLAYDLVNGPSGKGVTDLYTPEIAYFNTTIVNQIIAYVTFSWRHAKPMLYALHTAALLNWIQGLTSSGTKKERVPTLMGANYQAVSVAQQQAGYNPDLSFSSELLTALEATDAALGALVSALEAQKLASSTAIIVTAKHGQAPIDPATIHLNKGNLTAVIESIAPGEPALVTADDIALIWLKNSSNAEKIMTGLGKNATLGIKFVTPGSFLIGNFGDGVALVPPTTLNNALLAARQPDLVIVTDPGVIYTRKVVKAQHGGNHKDDTNVALLVVDPLHKAPSIHTATTYTTQVAPTVLGLLGLDPAALDAVKGQPGNPTVAILSGQTSYHG